MTKEEFYRQFANTPLKERFVVLESDLTLISIYEQIKEIDEKIRPDILAQQRLLKIADRYYFKKLKD